MDESSAMFSDLFSRFGRFRRFEWVIQDSLMGSLFECTNYKTPLPLTKSSNVLRGRKGSEM